MAYGNGYDSGPGDLLITLVIIAVLAAVAIPCFKKAIQYEFKRGPAEKSGVYLEKWEKGGR
jgi:hypothetical protein